MSIKSDTLTIRGKLGFNHLTKPYEFKGSSKFKLRVTNLSDKAVEALEERFGASTGMGPRIKFDEKYPESGQYTGFSSNFPIKVRYEGNLIITSGKDENGKETVRILDPIAEKIGRGSDIIVKLFGDSNGNPRVVFVDIVDLVTFGGEDEEEVFSYDEDEVL